jgi:hypothetical protein
LIVSFSPSGRPGCSPATDSDRGGNLDAPERAALRKLK